jgi:prefoldin subunit 5
MSTIKNLHNALSQIHREKQDLQAEVEALKAQISELMPSNDPLIVWSVSNGEGETLFKTLEDAQRYVGQFPASIGGGLYISETAVFGNIVKD